MEFKIIFALLVFIGVFVVLALDIANRAYIALLGAGLMLTFSIIPASTAFSKINLNVIAILISVELGFSPVPFIITQAIASNIGGTATLIGDPPNIMIGYSVPLSFNA